ncbi:DUF3263 domain-containing protein [Flaviflexus equikiangi]|uniref:DUF3263 domain-containing protein n=1 Tax=Flaviflexus equikiangi TaxID=2758573 RepID=A0ABS2TCS1_9ACTO|nr:DUF3263 domain-containing protein [Flaviflexus equikiangi]MBM9432436.1 DUF3263 domain-containing protein [Flaviflexus equikiangi]
MADLSDEDLLVLELEDTWQDRFPTKAEAIRQTLGWSTTKYHIRLNRLLDDTAAIYAKPVTVGRLRRLREARAAERGTTSAHSAS